MPETDKLAPDHYRSKYMHWDLVLDVHMGYFEGQVTKYVTRWRKKDGLKDLKKALHFLNKLIENEFRFVRSPQFVPISEDVMRFAAINSLSEMETALVLKMATWEDGGDLHEAQLVLMEIMNEADPEPVPASDSNKHAERAR